MTEYSFSLYIEDGDKVHLNIEGDEQARDMINRMKDNNEVFSFGRIEADNTITDLNPENF